MDQVLACHITGGLQVAALDQVLVHHVTGCHQVVLADQIICGHGTDHHVQAVTVDLYVLVLVLVQAVQDQGQGH